MLLASRELRTWVFPVSPQCTGQPPAPNVKESEVTNSFPTRPNVLEAVQVLHHLRVTADTRGGQMSVLPRVTS